MIIGIGTDLVNCTRIEAALDRFGTRFRARVFTDPEQSRAARKGPARGGAARGGAAPGALAAGYAKAFAAKEAVSKALGTGISGGIKWRDIELDRHADGRPKINLYGAAARRLDTLTPPGGVSEIYISLSDENPMALAYVIIYCRR